MNDKLLTDCKNKWKFTLCQFPFIHPSLSKPSMPFLNKVKFTFKRIYLSMRACNKLKSLPLHYIHRSEMRAFSSVPLVSVITAVIRSFESTSITQGRTTRNTQRREGGGGGGGRRRIVGTLIFYLKPSCMQEVFSRAYDLFVFRYHRLQDFLLESFSFQEFFWGELSPHLRLFPVVSTVVCSGGQGWDEQGLGGALGEGGNDGMWEI